MFRRTLFGLYWVLFGLLFTAAVHGSDESVCAEVKIEIAQELTMERQAFEATMRISNTLDGMDLEDIEIRLNLEDEDGDPVAGCVGTMDLDTGKCSRVVSA